MALLGHNRDDLGPGGLALGALLSVDHLRRSYVRVYVFRQDYASLHHGVKEWQRLRR